MNALVDVPFLSIERETLLTRQKVAAYHAEFSRHKAQPMPRYTITMKADAPKPDPSVFAACTNVRLSFEDGKVFVLFDVYVTDKLKIIGMLASYSHVRKANAELSEAELKAAALASLATRIEVPANCTSTVSLLTDGHGRGRKVVFDMKPPPGVLCMTARPEVHFSDREDAPSIKVWNLSDATDDMPSASAILQYFRYEVRDLDRCVAALAWWFDANRNRGRVVNFAYDRYATAYKAAGRAGEWQAVLDKELTLATAPEAIYEIRKHMARVHVAAGEPDEAIRDWEQAQLAMKGGSTSYFTTRQALPFSEIAKIYKQQGNLDKAAKNLELFRSSSYGKRHPFKPTKQLAEVYADQHRFKEARNLYMTLLAEDFGKSWHQGVLKRYQDGIRKQLLLLTTRENLAKLVEQLDDDNGQVRMNAYRQIKGLGKNALPLLREYEDHGVLEIEASVRKLISELQ